MRIAGWRLIIWWKKHDPRIMLPRHDWIVDLGRWSGVTFDYGYWEFRFGVVKEEAT